MANITTDRATKRAYFSDLAGGNILEFQFSPHTLDFSEGGKYATRLSTGEYFSDLVWLSGKSNLFNVRMFIDRTQESRTIDNNNEDPFDSIKRFPSMFTRLTSSLDAINLIRGIAQGNSSSGFASSFKKRNTDGANEVPPTSYSASPQFKQTQFNESAGVIPDVEALMYYVRPKGLKLDELTIQTDGAITPKDFEHGRFIPPPMVRFYFGNMWREGYIVDIKYNLSVMNKLLVPRRLDANIQMVCTRWGYLNDLNAPSNTEPIDAVTTITI